MNETDSPERPSADPSTHQAEAVDRHALYTLARQLIGQSRPREAVPVLMRAVAAGHAEAAVELARVFLFLPESEAEIAEAVRLLRWADAKAVPQAPYWLALVALGDSAIARDFEQINRWMLASARRKFPPAMRALALFFARSGTPSDAATSTALLNEACALGDAIAAQLLVERARLGESMPADPKLAADLARQLASHGFGPGANVPRAAPATGARADTSGQLSLERLLMLPTAQTLHDAPWVRVFDGVLSAEDCRFIAAMAQPHLSRSKVFDPDKGDAIEFQVRTSQDASIDPIQEDFWLRLLQLRMAAVSGGELINAEPLAVLRYGPGEQYHPHYDALPEHAEGQQLDRFGQRQTTLCCYLNPVEAGGATDFPNIGVRVQPAPGRAVVFDNLLADGLRHPDSLHAGMPVERGEKWLATLWLRQRPLRHF
jgi:hypothetical protein